MNWTGRLSAGMNDNNVKERVSDAKDVAKIVANAAAGNVLAVAATAIKNKRIRRILLVLILGALSMQVIGFLLMAGLIIGMGDMFRYPLMNFGSGHTIQENTGQATTIHFSRLANGWEKTIHWGFVNVGLTAAEVAQVNQLQLNLPYGLLETFYEIGVRQGVKNPLKTLDYVVQELEPSAIDFHPVKLRKVTFTKDPKTGKTTKVISAVTQMVLKDITRYNGFWTVQWHIVTESDGTQIVVLDGGTLVRKNYTPLYNAEKAFDFLHNTADQQALFGQALVLDPNFYDPNALPILQLLEGGQGGSPGNGVPLPSQQIVSILTQALQMDHEPLSWLSGMEHLVMNESSGNPDAVYHNPDGTVSPDAPAGLCQMMPSTFWAYHVQGYSNIWNPLDNAVASIRNIAQVYGTVYNIPNVMMRDCSNGQTTGCYSGYN